MDASSNDSDGAGLRFNKHGFEINGRSPAFPQMVIGNLSEKKRFAGLAAKIKPQLPSLPLRADLLKSRPTALRFFHLPRAGPKR